MIKLFSTRFIRNRIFTQPEVNTVTFILWQLMWNFLISYEHAAAVAIKSSMWPSVENVFPPLLLCVSTCHGDVVCSWHIANFLRFAEYSFLT